MWSEDYILLLVGGWLWGFMKKDYGKESCTQTPQNAMQLGHLDMPVHFSEMKIHTFPHIFGRIPVPSEVTNHDSIQCPQS